MMNVKQHLDPASLWSCVMNKSMAWVMLLGFLVGLPWASVANELTVTKIGQWGGRWTL